MDKNGIYRLKRAGRRGRCKKRSGGIFVVIFMLIATVAILNRQFFPFVSAVAESEAKNKIVRMLEEAVAEAVEAGKVEYSDLIRLSYKADGGVSSLECRMPQAIKLRAAVAGALLVGFRDESLMYVSVPIGSVSGIELLSGRGPSIDVRLVLAHGLTAYIGSEFYEAGINQTLHRVTVCIDVEIKVLTPTHTSTFSVAGVYPIAETVIVGEVPDAYTKINRLTDDITEDEIDDIYDFGASTD